MKDGNLEKESSRKVKGNIFSSEPRIIIMQDLADLVTPIIFVCLCFLAVWYCIKDVEYFIANSQARAMACLGSFVCSIGIFYAFKRVITGAIIVAMISLVLAAVIAPFFLEIKSPGTLSIYFE